MLTKHGSAVLRSLGKELVSPSNLAFTSFGVASGTQSLGELLGMSAGGIGGSKAYNYASGKLLPKALSATRFLPGYWGKAAGGAIKALNTIGSLGTTFAGSIAGSNLSKKVPLYKRKDPFPQHVKNALSE